MATGLGRRGGGSSRAGGAVVKLVLVLSENWTLTTLRAAFAEAGRDLSELGLVGGMRAVFPDGDSPSPLEPALASLPRQVARGFTTFCIKPSQFGRWTWRSWGTASPAPRARCGSPGTASGRS